MTIFLHIGMGKTGSTTLQTFLRDNSEALRNAGATFSEVSRSRNHRALAVCAMDDGRIDNTKRAKKLTEPKALHLYRADIEDEIRAEANNLEKEANIIFSSEQLTRLKNENELERLKGLLSLYGPHRIKVVCYLRRQDSYMVSAFSQIIKGGGQLDFTYKTCMKKIKDTDYQVFLEPWANSFGVENVIVRPFEKLQMFGGDIITDFLNLIDVELDLNNCRFPRIQNQSLDARALTLLSRLNRHLPRFGAGAKSRVRPAIVRALEEMSDGPKIRFGSADVARIGRHFSASNAYVAKTYLGRNDGVLFLEAPIADDQIAPSISDDDAYEMIANLLANIYENKNAKFDQNI